MLKKLIAYQKLLLKSTPPIDIIFLKSGDLFSIYMMISVMILTSIFIFGGNTVSLNSCLSIDLPIVSVWIINRILYGDHRLFETVPVSRKYIVLNIFLLSIVLIVIGYLLFWIAIVVFIWLLVGGLYLLDFKNITSPPQTVIHQIINTTKGDILMLAILVIILFMGVAITFIKNKKLRFKSFAAFGTIGYGLLIFLRLTMPISPSSGKVEFLESFSIMPQANIILFCVAITAVIICITSVFMGYDLYVVKSKITKYYKFP